MGLGVSKKKKKDLDPKSNIDDLVLTTIITTRKLFMNIYYIFLVGLFNEGLVKDLKHDSS